MEDRLSMKRPFVVVLLLLALSGLAQADNAALVTKLSGKVTLDGKPVKVAQKLPEKARLVVPSGASVSVVYMAGATQETLTGPGSMTIGANKALAHEGNLKSVPGPGQLRGQVQANHLKAGLASVRGSEDFDLVSARQLPNGQLELVWTAGERMDLDQPVNLELRDGNNKVLYSSKTEVGVPTKVEGRKLTTTVPLKAGEFGPGIPATVSIFTFEGDSSVALMLLTPEQQAYFDEVQAWAAKSAQGDHTRYLYLAQLSLDWLQGPAGIQAAREADRRTGEKDATVAALLYRLLALNGHLAEMDRLKPRLEAYYVIDSNTRALTERNQ